MNLEGYETVASRKKSFYKDFTDGRIIVELVKGESKEAIVKAMIFKSFEEQVAQMPLATGYAQEFQGSGGHANKFAWLENCEQSAIGRALANAGYATTESCTREEMISVFQKQKELEEYKVFVQKYVKEHGPEKTREIIGPSDQLKTIDDWKDAFEALQV